MADGTAPSATEPQAGSAATPQAGTPATERDSAPPTTDTAEAPPAGAEALSLDEARKLRQESHALRQRLKAFEDAKKAEDDAKLTEHERLTKRAAELEAQIAAAQAAGRLLRTRLAVEREARALHLVDEDAAYRLLDADAIEYAEDTGEPKNVRALLKKLAEQKPYLVAPAPAPEPGAAAPGGPLSFGTNGQNGLNGTPLAGTPRPDTGRALSQQEDDRRRLGVLERARAAF